MVFNLFHAFFITYLPCCCPFFFGAFIIFLLVLLLFDSILLIFGFHFDRIKLRKINEFLLYPLKNCFFHRHVEIKGWFEFAEELIMLIVLDKFPVTPLDPQFINLLQKQTNFLKFIIFQELLHNFLQNLGLFKLEIQSRSEIQDERDEIQYIFHWDRW